MASAPIGTVHVSLAAALGKGPPDFAVWVLFYGPNGGEEIA